MIRIGVVSDSHGALALFEKAVNEMGNVHAIVHLGDCAHDAYSVSKALGRKIITLNGNCDFMSYEPISRILEMGGKRFFLTHGHKEHVKMGLTRLGYRAEAEGVDCALYGHTHIPGSVMFGSVLLINPGAMKDGNYCVIAIEDGIMTPEFRHISIKNS